MIQRIQSLYLFIAFVAAILLFFFPFATFLADSSTFYEFSLTGLKYHTPEGVTTKLFPVFMLSLNIILTALIGFSIFLFKNRVTQMRVVAVSFLLNAILIGIIFYFSDKYGKELDFTPNYKNLGTLMPVLMLIMLLLANKAIKKDEIKMRKSRRVR